MQKNIYSRKNRERNRKNMREQKIKKEGSHQESIWVFLFLNPSDRKVQFTLTPWIPLKALHCWRLPPPDSSRVSHTQECRPSPVCYLLVCVCIKAVRLVVQHSQVLYLDPACPSVSYVSVGTGSHHSSCLCLLWVSAVFDPLFSIPPPLLKVMILLYPLCDFVALTLFCVT